jgi:uncharacterized protein (TIGR02996 family)
MQNDREALVTAIRERPDDDGPRLVCADWFEEQGADANVARAAFIRTQVARARLSPQDPQQSELEARELRLLNQYARAWCGSHPVFKKSRFRRGFIEYVHLHLQHFQHHRRRLFALEPVRDVSLTGWMRASDDLVGRVAACEEWRHVETLRIHHQRPEKSPRSNVVRLISSPHLTGLKSLRLPMLAIDPAARRRLERLPVLGRLTDLTLPNLDTNPNDPGWLSDGLPPRAFARLRSLRLGHTFLSSGARVRLSAAPFWDRLQSLALTWYSLLEREGVSSLYNRLPSGLESFRLEGISTGSDTLYSKLATRPLRRLEIHEAPISPGVLASILGETGRSELRELTLIECGLTDEHLAVLAGSPGTGRLESLHLAQFAGVSPAAADVLFSSKGFGSLVSLRVEIPSFWSRGLDSFACAPVWSSLRKLAIVGGGYTPSALGKFLDSPSARRLVRLAIVDDDRGKLSVSTDLIDRFGRLPHLARLRLFVNDLDQPTRAHLSRLKPRIWSTVQSYVRPEEYDVEPNDLPPLDEDLVELDQRS